VHRSRLFAQHLPSFEWQPIILTVHEKHYEEMPDWKLHQLLPDGQRIEKVAAFPLTKPRLIGDLGLRAFFHLRKRALELIREEDIAFVYITIPSFYVAMLGPFLHRKTGVRYGIDYIDPWVHTFPGSDKKFSRHWWSTKLARLLEPKAVRKASLITGVSQGYYEGVISRNPFLINTCLFGAMPYGGELEDHRKVSQMEPANLIFSDNRKFKFIYAGALLPKAFGPLEAMFKAIANDRRLFENTEFYFIGTGRGVGNENDYTVQPLAEKYGLWQSVIIESPARMPYLEVLYHLHKADAVFVLGSTEKHYTPSKIYQAVFSRKPVMAILHEDSTAVSMLRSTGGGLVLDFKGRDGVGKIEAEFSLFFQHFISFAARFSPSSVINDDFEPYSAKAVTEKLVHLLERVS
jgi:hypothetical protein